MLKSEQCEGVTGLLMSTEGVAGGLIESLSVQRVGGNVMV